jgi:hypothetical protein
MVRTVMTDPEFRDPAMTDAELELAIDFMIGFVTVMGVIGLLLSIFIIIAGVMAVKRKSWGLGLAGAIVSLFVFAPTGIPALIFIALGKPEFEPAKAFPPADPAPPGSF